MAATLEDCAVLLNFSPASVVPMEDGGGGDRICM